VSAHCLNTKQDTPTNSGRWITSETPVILCVIHHRQNSVESNISIVALEMEKDYKQPLHMTYHFQTTIVS
jgi:hypothetical protein